MEYPNVDLAIDILAAEKNYCLMKIINPERAIWLIF